MIFFQIRVRRSSGGRSVRLPSIVSSRESRRTADGHQVAEEGSSFSRNLSQHQKIHEHIQTNSIESHRTAKVIIILRCFVALFRVN